MRSGEEVCATIANAATDNSLPGGPILALEGEFGQFFGSGPVRDIHLGMPRYHRWQWMFESVTPTYRAVLEGVDRSVDGDRSGLRLI